MDFTKTICKISSTLGLDEKHGKQLAIALKPLEPVVKHPEDFGLFFPTRELCEKFGTQNSLEPESVEILFYYVKQVRESQDVFLDSCIAPLTNPVPLRADTVPNDTPQPVFPDLSRASKVSESAVRKLKSDLNTAKSGLKLLRVPAVSLALPAEKLNNIKLKAKEAQLIQDCLDLLHRIGPVSPTFCWLFGADGSKIPSTSEKSSLERMFFQVDGRKVRFPHVHRSRKDFDAFLNYIHALGVNLQDLSPFVTAAFLSDNRYRGATVPARLWASLRWAESIFSIDVHCSVSYVKMESDKPNNRKPPKQAKCPEISMVVQIELVVCDESVNPVYRIIGGIYLLLVHGVLRWADLQNAFEVTMGKHAILGKSDMKKQGVRSWACLLVGFSKQDWGTTFWKLLQERGMPGSDFFVFSFIQCYTSFSSRPASYQNMLNAVRFFLSRTLNMQPVDSCAMTLHGPRHLYPSAARQMLLSGGEQTELGHWVENSGMPRMYDSTMSSAEAVAKNKVIWAFQHGRKMCEPGEIPEPVDEKEVGISFYEQFSSRVPKIIPARPEFSPTKPGHGTFLSESRPTSLKYELDEALTCGKRPRKSPSSSSNPVPHPVPQPLAIPSLGDSDPPVQVINSSTQRVHLYHPSISKTQPICNLWTCGEPAKPRAFVEFMQSEEAINLLAEPLAACDRCFSEKRFSLLLNRGQVLTRHELIRLSDHVPGDSDISVCFSDESSPSSIPD